MPDYLFTAPNGKSIKVTGDTLPSESELDSIFKAAGVDTSSGDTFSRRGGASSQAMVSAPDATAEPDVVTLGELRDNPKAAMQRIGAILGKDATDPKLWLTLAASYLAPKVFSAVAPTLGKAAAGARGLATTGMVKDLATVGLGEGRVGAGLRIAGRVADAVRPVAVAAPEPAVSSPQPVQATGTSMTPAPMPTLRAAPAPEPVQPSPAPEPAIPVAKGKSPQQIANETALSARRAQYQQTQQAQPESASTDPAAELARRLGTPSDAERTFPPNKSGLPTKAPTATKARGKIADLADMPPPETAQQAEPMAKGGTIASVAGASSKPFSVLESQYPDVSMNISESAHGGQKIWTLDKIVVPKDQRGTGTGTQIMQKLVRLADENGATLALSPSSDFGGSIGRLREFYGRFGFIKNTGRSADQSISASMVRVPR